MAIRVAVTGRTATPPLFDTLVALGRERTLERLDRAIEVLLGARREPVHDSDMISRPVRFATARCIREHPETHPIDRWRRHHDPRRRAALARRLRRGLANLRPGRDRRRCSAPMRPTATTRTTSRSPGATRSSPTGWSRRDAPGTLETAHYEPFAVDGDRAVAIGESRYRNPDGSFRTLYYNLWTLASTPTAGAPTSSSTSTSCRASPRYRRRVRRPARRAATLGS